MYPSFYSNSIEEQLSHPLLKRNRKRLFEQKKNGSVALLEKTMPIPWTVYSTWGRKSNWKNYTKIICNSTRVDY